jgi:succinoglycan biosynthesis protein ExoV
VHLRALDSLKVFSRASTNMSVAIATTHSRAASRFTAPWRLEYYRDSIGNFGDDLNPFLWSRLLPDLLDDRAPNMLVGLGTILNHELPPGPKVIAGAGVGYGTAPKLTDDWRVHFVRGPLTALSLGLSQSYAITDPAHLITQFIRPRVRGTGTLYVPHHMSALLADWRSVANAAGLDYVDPAGDPMQVVEAIRNARLVITSAMHGAILADAFRVPWIRVREYPHINEFKWQDWGASMEVDVSAEPLPELHDHSQSHPVRRAGFMLRTLRREGRATRTTPQSTTHVDSGSSLVNSAIASLQQLSLSGRGTLSDDAVLGDRIEALLDAVQRLRNRMCPRGVT